MSKTAVSVTKQPILFRSFSSTMSNWYKKIYLHNVQWAMLIKHTYMLIEHCRRSASCLKSIVILIKLFFIWETENFSLWCLIFSSIYSIWPLDHFWLAIWQCQIDIQINFLTVTLTDCLNNKSFFFGIEDTWAKLGPGLCATSFKRSYLYCQRCHSFEPRDHQIFLNHHVVDT